MNISNKIINDIENLFNKYGYCTMVNNIDLCKIKLDNNNYKYPKLTELYEVLTGETYEQKHTALDDAMLLYKCIVKKKEFKD